MPSAKTINRPDLAKLRKIWALTSSSSAGEATAARERAAAIMARYGKTLADVPEVLKRGAQAEPASECSPGFQVYTFDFADVMEKQEPGYKARTARTRARYRASVIQKYGSEAAAMAPTPIEQAIEDAAAPFKRQERLRSGGHIFEFESIGGWTDVDEEPVPDDVRRAIERAWPLPTTLAEAKAEHDLWEERDQELEAIDEGRADTFLYLACWVRQLIIQDLLHTRLRAQTLAEVLIRQRPYVSLPSTVPEIEQAVLADLEHLVASAQTAQNGRSKTAGPRRRAAR